MEPFSLGIRGSVRTISRACRQSVSDQAEATPSHTTSASAPAPAVSEAIDNAKGAPVADASGGAAHAAGGGNANAVASSRASGAAIAAVDIRSDEYSSTDEPAQRRSAA